MVYGPKEIQCVIPSHVFFMLSFSRETALEGPRNLFHSGIMGYTIAGKTLKKIKI
jgi:hypothetical protein